MADFYPHIFITGNFRSEKYKASPKQGKRPSLPQRERDSHSLMQKPGLLTTFRREGYNLHIHS